MRPFMDATGTAAEAAKEGCSRRTIQRRRARMKKEHVAEVAQLVVEPALPGMNKLFMEPPAPKRAEMEEAAARAGSLESLLYQRALSAACSGDPVQARLWVETWGRAQQIMRGTEDQILEIKEHKSKLDEFNRKTDEVLEQLRWNQRNPVHPG